ncbi:MAG: MarR family transcriptional regulator [Acidobacteriota bacterium]
MASDPISRLIDQWKRERPDLDASPMGLVGRVLRLAVLLERRVEATLARFDLTLWQFDVLATLRRSGKPYRLSPTQLMREVMLSSGAMTNRIDRLESRGLVKRCPEPADRRSVQIELTPEGKRLVDRAIAARFEEAREVTRFIGAHDRDLLERGLSRLLLALEEQTSAPP